MNILENAINLQKRKEYLKSEEEYIKLLESFKDDQLFHLYFGFLFQEQGKLDKAALEYDLAYKIDPKPVPWFSSLWFEYFSDLTDLIESEFLITSLRESKQQKIYIDFILEMIQSEIKLKTIDKENMIELLDVALEYLNNTEETSLLEKNKLKCWTLEMACREQNDYLTASFYRVIVIFLYPYSEEFVDQESTFDLFTSLIIDINYLYIDYFYMMLKKRSETTTFCDK